MARSVQIFLSVLLILTVCSASAQPIDWDSVRAAYITKYQPQQMPAWLFPIIFEEGTGQRDTIYLGYDDDALPNFGEIWFGEIFEPVDTSKFSVSICLDFSFDSIYKVSVSPLQNISQCGGGSFDFSFFNGYLPLKMYWDQEGLYSDSLPFPDQAPAPRAQGEFFYSTPIIPYPLDTSTVLCDQQYAVLLTDSITLSECYFRDSLQFIDASGSQTMIGGWIISSFKIAPWTGKWVGVKKRPDVGSSFKVFPNPAKDYLHIEVNYAEQFTYQLYSLMGNQVLSGSDTESVRIETAALIPGYYILRVTAKNYYRTFHLIVSP